MGTPLDEMVLLKDGMIKITAPLAEGNPPVVESAVNDCPSSRNGDGPLLSVIPTQELTDVPSKTFHDNGVSVQQPEHGGSAHEILSEQIGLMPQPSSVMASLNGGQGSRLAKCTIRNKDINSDVIAVEEGEIQKVMKIKPVEEKKSEVADCLVDAEFKAEARAGDSAEVPLLGSGEKQRQTAVENEERNTEVGQDNVAEYIGRKVLKRFGRKDFVGDVVVYEPEYKWFKVIYEDGDEEDLERAEVEAILLPLGSFPAFASCKRPPPEGAVEEGYERELKKMKVEVGKPYREGNKARLLRSKNCPKSLDAVADSPRCKAKGFLKRHSLVKKPEKLRGSRKDSDIKPPISRKSGNLCQGLLHKDKSGLAGYKTISSVIENKKPKLGKGSLGSSLNSSSIATSLRKLKILKEPKVGEEKPLQKLEDMQNSSSPFKNEFKEGRKSGTGISLQEGINRYLQKLKDAQQKAMPRAKRKAEQDSNGRPRSKHSKKETLQNFGIAVNPFSEGLKDCNQESTASKHSTVKGHDSDGVELGDTLIGRSTRKKFNGKFFSGNVVSYDKKRKFYKVRYEDGDQEDLEWSELEPTLVVKRKQNAPSKVFETAQNLRIAFNSLPEGLKDRNQGNRAGKRSTVEGHNSEGVELGATLIGRSTRKKFSGKFFSGDVVSYDMKTKFYKVRYEDGDQEDLEWSELEPTLVVKRKQNAPAKSNSAKGSTSKLISDRSEVVRRKTRSIPH